VVKAKVETRIVPYLLPHRRVLSWCAHATQQHDRDQRMVRVCLRCCADVFSASYFQCISPREGAFGRSRGAREGDARGEESHQGSKEARENGEERRGTREWQFDGAFREGKGYRGLSFQRKRTRIYWRAYGIWDQRIWGWSWCDS
jgi:hypothetical protein